MTDEDYALLYAFALVTGQLGDEIGKVGAEVEGLFGVLDEEQGGETVWVGGTRVEHCGFGTEDQVGPITKGKPYAGLKKWL